jgi:hypothetical protein
MVNHHLIWILESINLFSDTQYEFLCHRSSLDHLMNLEYHIQNSFILFQHFVSVLCDLEEVCDIMWYSNLRTLHVWNLWSLLLFFLSDFLQDCYSCVCLAVFICMLSSTKWSTTGISFNNYHLWDGLMWLVHLPLTLLHIDVISAFYGLSHWIV